jgi:hypothetical protein
MGDCGSTRKSRKTASTVGGIADGKVGKRIEHNPSVKSASVITCTLFFQLLSRRADTDSEPIRCSLL